MKPNILFLMCDQFQAALLEGEHPCKTPNLDRLRKRGIHFKRAYTSNAVCTPARAGIMTGLLPHNHGALVVTHTADDDQFCLRKEKPHFAQRLKAGGYNTGYFGKWHVERTNRLEPFGWDVNCVNAVGFSPQYLEKRKLLLGGEPPRIQHSEAVYCQAPEGYRPALFTGIRDNPVEQTNMALATEMAIEYISLQNTQTKPWMCMLSFSEPHDPYVCGREARDLYDADFLSLPETLYDEGERPNLYRIGMRCWKNFSDRQLREALACYYGCVTEADAQFGRVLDILDRLGITDNTVVIFTADHGDCMGAHGLFCKTIGSYEEIYNVPLIVAGPGMRVGAESFARVGTHALCPTIIELSGCEAIEELDTISFASALFDDAAEKDYTLGYAEYNGGRILLTQRIVYKDDIKYVFNGFDMDELYDLSKDPLEKRNLANLPEYDALLREMSALMWAIVRDTGDRSLYNSNYPALRVASYGPDLSKVYPKGSMRII